MTSEVLVALIGVAGASLGSFAGVVTSAKMTAYRLERLEREVNEHNNIIKRTFVLEEKINVANNRIHDLEEEVKK